MTTVSVHQSAFVVNKMVLLGIPKEPLLLGRGVPCRYGGSSTGVGRADEGY